MSVLGAAAIVLVTVPATELLANVLHRHVMHGFGWRWHRSHHEQGPGWFETNDLYAVMFALASLGLYLIGERWPPAVWIATGLVIYGLLYTIAHDGLVHRRWPFGTVPRRGYVKRLYQAHRLHHAIEGRDGGVSFGFLYARPIAQLRHEMSGGHRDDRPQA